jgi:hypothetical protein
VSNIAVHGQTRGTGCTQRWSARAASALVLIASLSAAPTWSQQLQTASPPDAQTRPGRDPNPFAPLQSPPPARSTQAAPQFNRAVASVPPEDKQPIAPGRTKINRFLLGIETEHRFRPDELPGGEKTHALTYQRELQVKPFLGLSLTSPIE